MKKHRNIHRIDYEIKNTYAWLVLVQRDYQKTVKMFSDSVYGGKRKSLKAAIEFRDQLVMSTTPHYHLKKRTFLRRNNTSGIAGVGRYDVIDNPITRITTVYIGWLCGMMNTASADNGAFQCGSTVK